MSFFMNDNHQGGDKDDDDNTEAQTKAQKLLKELRILIDTDKNKPNKNSGPGEILKDIQKNLKEKIIEAHIVSKDSKSSFKSSSIKPDTKILPEEKIIEEIPKENNQEENNLARVFASEGESLKQENFNASPEMLDFLKNYEKLEVNAKNPGDGTITAGYGVVIRDQKGGYPLGKETFDEYMNKSLTDEDGTKLLQKVIIPYENAVNDFIKANNLTLAQNQFDALLDLAYNAGVGIFQQKNEDGTYYYTIASNLAEKDIAGNPTEEDKERFEKGLLSISSAILGGKRIRGIGLVERRMDELDIFFRGEYNRGYQGKTPEGLNEMNKLLNKYGLSPAEHSK